MKTLLAILAPLLFVSCAVKTAPDTQAPMAPTILMPAESVRADLGEAAVINDQLAEGNRQMSNLVAEGRATRYELNMKMSELIAAKAANEADLMEVNEHLIRQQGLIDQGKEIIVQQKSLIKLQGDQLVEADGLIETGEIEKAALRETVKKAEEQMQEMALLMEQIAEQRGEARLEAAETAGKAKTLAKTSLIRLIWAISATIALVGLIAWKIYRFFSNPLSLVT